MEPALKHFCTLCIVVDKCDWYGLYGYQLWSFNLTSRYRKQHSFNWDHWSRLRCMLQVEFESFRMICFIFFCVLWSFDVLLAMQKIIPGWSCFSQCYSGTLQGNYLSATFKVNLFPGNNLWTTLVGVLFLCSAFGVWMDTHL